MTQAQPNALRILVIEDDPSIADWLKLELAIEGYDVTAVTAKFSELYDAADDSYDVVISDYALRSTVTGCDLLGCFPSALRIMVSAHLDDLIPDECPADLRLGKPLDMGRLMGAINAAR